MNPPLLSARLLLLRRSPQYKDGLSGGSAHKVTYAAAQRYNPLVRFRD
jgi:hypothetical protein